MQRVHIQVRVGVFNYEQMLTEISFVILDIVVKKEIECGLGWSVLLSTMILVITVVKICCETIFSSDTSTKRETAIFKICPPSIITVPEVIIAEYDAILGQ